VKWFAQAPTRRDFPERIEIVDIAPPGASWCELEIVPESEEGKIPAPTATYVRERKRLSRRERFVGAVFVTVVILAQCLGAIS